MMHSPVTHALHERAKAKQAKIHKTMSEFEDATLHSGSKTGPLVTSRAQAIAISMNQARKVGKG